MLLSSTGSPTSLRASAAAECLACGATRVRVEGDACGRCGYVGWAWSVDLTESERRALRELALERRALRELALEKRAPRRPLFAA